MALHLQRDIGVNDVDVLLSMTDASHVRDKLAIPFSAISPHPLFHSEEYFTWNSHALPTEFMAGFSVCVEGEWRKVIFHTRQSFEVADHTVFTPDAKELASLLRLFGRPKDMARLALLS